MRRWFQLTSEEEKRAMADTLVLRSEKAAPVSASHVADVPKQEPPTLASLQGNLAEASRLVDDIVLKKYLHCLSDMEVIPLGEDLKKICDIRIFKITEMVYQNEEYSTYKFASVFNAVQNLNCGVFIIADSDGKKTDFYMGVRSLDEKRTTKSLKDTLKMPFPDSSPALRQMIC